MDSRQAEEIVDRIVEDIKRCRGLKQEWEPIDEIMKQEIKDVWLSIYLNSRPY